MNAMTRKRVDVLVRAIIAEYGYPVSLHLVEQTDNGAWRITVDTTYGSRSSFILPPASSPDMYFAVREKLQRL